MYQIRKLSEIKNYRAYENFVWDESVKLFDKYNIIFGWNASGKSSIADLLLQLSDNTQFEEDTQFKILFQNELSERLDIKRDRTYSDKYTLRVFDQNFIERNIEKTDPLKHIFSIGENQISISKELKASQTRIESCESAVDKAKEVYSNATKKQEQHLIKHASSLKNELDLPNSYNKNNYLSDFQKCNNPMCLDPSSYANLVATIKCTSLPELPRYEQHQVNPSIRTYIYDLLANKPIITAIELLREHADVAKWAAEGLMLHKAHNSKKCMFCDNEITEERLKILEAHFNKEFQDLSEKIAKTVERLAKHRESYNTLHLTYLKSHQFYPELQGQFISIQSELSDSCQTCISLIDQIESLLKNKQSNMTSIETASQFEALEKLSILTTDITENINSLIDRNNEITKHYSEVIQTAQSKAKSHWFSKNEDELKNLIRDTDDALLKFNRAKQLLEEAKQQKQELFISSCNSSIPAIVMNEELARFLGRDEIQFLEQENGYELSRNGKLAHNLSKGEKNAIALVYFLNSLEDMNIEKNETIVVLDDPISSFDSNYYYYALSYIRDSLNNVGQLFILTHKFSFYKDLCKVFKDEKSRHFLLERDRVGVHLKNESRFMRNYYDEYLYLFNKVVSFAINPNPNYDDSLTIANLARKVLESYLAFKVPTQDEIIDKVRSLSNELSTPTRAMCRLLNSKSHLQIIPDQDRGDDIEVIHTMQFIIRDMLNFMFENDKHHFKTLLSNCDDIPEGLLDDEKLAFPT